MSRAKTRKAPARNARAPLASRHRKQQETVEKFIQGLDLLAAYAETTQMGTAARIFFTAKEELVHWAVTMNFHESAQDRFINSRLYDTRVISVEALMLKALRDTSMEGKIMGLLGIAQEKAPPHGAARRKLPA